MNEDTRYVRTKSRLLRMLLPFFLKDEARYYLHGVHVEPSPNGGILLVATDGHRMAIVHDAKGESNGNWINPIPRPAVPIILSSRSTRKQNARVREADCVFSGDALYIVKGDSAQPLDKVGDDTLLAVGAKPIDGTFPDWRRVVPREIPETMANDRTFNANYLGDFAKVSEEVDPSITLYRAGPADPCIVRVAGTPEFVGIQMPMRYEDAPALPDWLDLPPVEAKKE